MKQVTIETYRGDPLYPRIVRASARLLRVQDEIVPVELLVAMDVLSSRDLQAWQLGQVPYLERVVHGSLPRLARLLRILRMHAHDLKLAPREVPYFQHGSQNRRPLRFTKTSNRSLESAYRRHFHIVGDPRKFRIKHALAPNG